MGHKRHIIVQKGLKMHKNAKIEFLDLKTCFLAELGGTDNHCAQRSVAERGEVPPPPPPLMDKIR